MINLYSSLFILQRYSIEYKLYRNNNLYSSLFILQPIVLVDCVYFISFIFQFIYITTTKTCFNIIIYKNLYSSLFILQLINSFLLKFSKYIYILVYLYYNLACSNNLLKKSIYILVYLYYNLNHLSLFFLLFYIYILVYLYYNCPAIISLFLSIIIFIFQFIYITTLNLQMLFLYLLHLYSSLFILQRTLQQFVSCCKNIYILLYLYYNYFSSF